MVSTYLYKKYRFDVLFEVHMYLISKLNCIPNEELHIRMIMMCTLDNGGV